MGDDPPFLSGRLHAAGTATTPDVAASPRRRALALAARARGRSPLATAAQGLPLLLAVALTPAAGLADGAPSLQASVIRGDVLRDVRGAIGVNQAAGSGNAQANAASLSLGEPSAASVITRQRTQSGASKARATRVRIEGGAFRGARGRIAVNQSAGAANAQSNVIAIAAGIDGQALDDAALAGVGVDQTTETSGDGAGRGPAETAIEAGAFSGARGVIQVNQAAGDGNATSNVFELRTDAQ